MIDFHAHILPGLDDGASDADEARKLLLSQQEQGIDTVIATPHYTGEVSIQEFLENRRISLGGLTPFLSHALPKIIPAAEVSLFYGLAEIEYVSQLCIEQTDYMLIEMPFSTWGNWEYTEICKLMDNRGIRPILAHVDRYVRKESDEKKLERFLELDVVLQLNAESLLRFTERRVAKRLLQKGVPVLLGSDCHNSNHRPCRMQEAQQVIQKKWGKEVLEGLEKNAKAVVANLQPNYISFEC